MNTEKAIEILEEMDSHAISLEDEQDSSALKLGIEALKRHQERRQRFSYLPHLLLPGETEDSSQEAEEINPEPTNP